MEAKAKKEKQLKRAMIATWSDSDSNKSEDEEEKRRTFALWPMKI